MTQRSCGQPVPTCSASRSPRRSGSPSFNGARAGAHRRRHARAGACPARWCRSASRAATSTLVQSALADVGGADARPRRSRSTPTTRRRRRPPRRRRRSPTGRRRRGRPGDDADLDALGQRRRPADHGERCRVNPRYTFDAFVTGTSNRFAHAAALVGGRDAGPVLQPAVHLRRRRPRQDPPAAGHRPLRAARTTRPTGCATSPPRRFLNEFVDAIRTNAPADVQARYREVDVLLRRRHPVHRGQGGPPGGVLPHLQRPPRGQPPDRAVARIGRPTPSPPSRTGCAAGSRWA